MYEGFSVCSRVDARDSILRLKETVPNPGRHISGGDLRLRKAAAGCVVITGAWSEAD